MNKEEAIDILKGWRDYNKKHKNMLLKADEIIEVQDTVLIYIEELENKLKTQTQNYHSAMADINWLIKTIERKKFYIPEYCGEFVAIEDLKEFF